MEQEIEAVAALRRRNEEYDRDLQWGAIVVLFILIEVAAFGWLASLFR